MAEYINRAELIENLNKFAPEHYNALINQLITKQPTADVEEVKHGEWDSNGDFYNCSVCDNYAGYDYDYCPYCGAKMDGKLKERAGKK